MKYHINPETGNVLVCRAKHRCRFGPDEAHFATAEEGRRAYEHRAELSTLTREMRQNKISRGAKLLLALDRAHHVVANQLRINEMEGRDTYDYGVNQVLADAQINERNRLMDKLEKLPWDDTDGPDFNDEETIDFETITFSGSADRRGYDNDAFQPTVETAALYARLDAASAAWISRLSTAEINALVIYNSGAKFYAQHMAGDKVTPSEWETWDPVMVKYLHSAVAKAPRTRKPFIVYAGVASERVVMLNEEAKSGKFVLNRIQSSSANPAQVNGFMFPSDWTGAKDETAVEFTLNRVASLSAFNIHRGEMEILVPPGTYCVEETLHDVNYYWGEGRQSGRRAANVHRATAS